MKILTIQPINGQLHAIMDDNETIPVAHIEGNVSPGKTVEHNGLTWIITSATMESCPV